MFKTKFENNSVKCNFPITVVRYKGRIPKIGDKNAKDVPGDNYIFIEEQAAWSQKYLTHNWSDAAKARGFIVASDPLIYAEQKYFECIPQTVFYSKTHRSAYLSKHKVANATLTDNMISEVFFVLKCNAEVVEQVDYNEHCTQLHGVMASTLKVQQSIKVDPKLTFKLDPALNIENVGTKDHKNILQSWYTKGVASAVITKNTNKALIIPRS